jgi:hypothetical protein
MSEPTETVVPTGPIWSAILAASIACSALGVLGVLTEIFPVVSKMLTFVKSSGDLSGATTVSLAIWIAVWILLHRTWKSRSITMPRLVFTASFLLILVGLAGTFPPVADWLSGK